MVSVNHIFIFADMINVGIDQHTELVFDVTHVVVVFDIIHHVVSAHYDVVLVDVINAEVAFYTMVQHFF